MNSDISTLVELLARAVYKRWRAGEIQSDEGLASPARLHDEQVSVAAHASYTRESQRAAGALLKCASTPMPDTAQNGKQKRR